MSRLSSYAILLVLFAAFISGCAQTKQILVYEEKEQQQQVWPASPEQPRYKYIGQLTGDENLIREGEGFLDKLFTLLTGLVRSEDERIVLQRPQSGVVDEQRKRIYVTDVSRQGVFVFDEKEGSVEIWDRADKQLSFLSPIGIALTESGDILVADADLAQIVRLGPEGEPRGLYGNGILKRPTGIARDPVSRRIYVSDTHAHNIKIFDDRGRFIRAFGDRGEKPGQFNFPTHLTFKNNRLYVTDTMNARIQVYSREGELEFIFGKRGIYMGDMPRPKGVAVDSEGNIYVVESYYDHLLIYNFKGDFLLPIGGTGTEIGQFYLPSGVWTDSRDRVYVADMFNGRILILQYLGNS